MGMDAHHISRELLYWAQGVAKDPTERRGRRLQLLREEMQRLSQVQRFYHHLRVRRQAEQTQYETYGHVHGLLAPASTHRQQLNKQDLTAYGLSPSAELTLVGSMHFLRVLPPTVQADRLYTPPVEASLWTKSAHVNTARYIASDRPYGLPERNAR